ncbi:MULTISPECIES: acetoin dehydrogenase dihydrolipoyllysine-residue acetyltransferase subunit [Brucella/Ochrobactrum group]|uniref:Acetoin dehydrogenase dihydrolipoyllysine-residue acetyltransferase subunit n=1 Tax=Brucella pseudintermedia TaxID=370111 RepID=A0ABY5UEE6_9HYPH|nr:MULTISPECIES: acetoin dehydrogenase dihydrolipoyllysine-residue acetyltransferase subunit [Brucella/Ochrobactrum group]KAB2677754.1 acetoin dehydrogenase dihydrolipoyllysine-residue acetyltransferase subunit [Brucella pseudintermedia]NKE75295.1 acetoin dehydrogenase dihydrolipoyllysine-residue acetyltransferase subunit [Ochrobactrum sp. MC-1LL]UWL61723.1 acetoin dehydrogenase dihydrolipoyllysine-residue acetyltransferase subunit [Brucella pseudintermedia]
MADITPILMPKWGLSMKEGKLSAWHVSEGDTISPGDEIMDVETDKIANVVEAADGGLLRRRIGAEGETYPVRALLAVMAPENVTDAEIDAYVASYATPAAGSDDEAAGPSYQYADLSIGRIRYAERPGQGTALILIHGFGGDLDNWLFNIDALAEGGPVYAPDLPGHGQSVKSARPAGLDLLVETVTAFMDRLGLERAHLAGHSMGGLVAGTLAARHPERAASVTLICSAGLGPEINSDYIDGFVNAAGRKELKPVLAHLFNDQSLVSRSMIEDLLKYKRLDGVSEFLSELAGSLFSAGRQAAEMGGALAASGVRTQVIWGQGDAIIPAAHAENLPSATCHVIPDAGHMVQMEQAAEVNRLIRDFIA